MALLRVCDFCGKPLKEKGLNLTEKHSVCEDCLIKFFEVIEQMKKQEKEKQKIKVKAVISKGDKLECIDCGKVFKVKDIIVTPERELIECPHCRLRRDIQEYHFMKEW